MPVNDSPELLAVPKLEIPRSLSKKRHIYNALLSRIQDKSMPVGMRLPSASVLASEWQVAYATVHAALNELTREGWLVRYPKQGTFVSEPPSKRPEVHTRTAAVILPPQSDIVAAGSGDEVLEVLQGLAKGARSHGWQIRIENIPSDPTLREQEHAMESIRGAASAIFIGGGQFRPMIEALSSGGFPVMSVMALADPGFGSAVTYDRPMALRMALNHLFERGYRKIGYFGNTRESDPQSKFQTYLEILRREGLEPESAWIGHCAAHRQARGLIEEYLRREPGCNAVFVSNYRYAAALAQKARQRGLRIPQDLAIFAHGIEGSHIDEIALTHTQVPYADFGVEAMQWIASNTGPKKERKIITLQPRLIVREST